VFFALLAIAEAFAHNTNDKKREHLFNTFGVWFFAAAIAFELAGYVYGQRNDSLSANTIKSLDTLSHDADSTARGAKVTADAAKNEAREAKTTSGDAKADANNARGEVEAVNDGLNILAAYERENAVPRFVMAGPPIPGSPREADFKAVRAFSGTRAYIQWDSSDGTGTEEKLARQIDTLLRDARWDSHIVSPPPQRYGFLRGSG
jgi:hypothetical protein